MATMTLSINILLYIYVLLCDYSDEGVKRAKFGEEEAIDMQDKREIPPATETNDDEDDEVKKHVSVKQYHRGYTHIFVFAKVI